jgi:hypothetical protein
MASTEMPNDSTPAEPSDLALSRASDDGSDKSGPSWKPTASSTYGKDEIITLLVGAEKTEMVAISSCLSFYSEFFRTALKKEWAEGQTRTVRLPEEEPGIIAQYLDFLLGKGLPTDSVQVASHNGEGYVALTTLFAFGERMLDSTLRNAIIWEIIRFTTIPSANGSYIYPGVNSINDIYNCTTSASPARRLMVDLYIHAGNTTWVVDTLHPAFLKDLAEMLMLQVQGSGLSCRVYRIAAEDYSV